MSQMVNRPGGALDSEEVEYIYTYVLELGTLCKHALEQCLKQSVGSIIVLCLPIENV